MKNRLIPFLISLILVGYSSLAIAGWPGECWVVVNQFDSEVIFWDVPESHQTLLATWSFDEESGNFIMQWTDTVYGGEEFMQVFGTLHSYYWELGQWRMQSGLSTGANIPVTEFPVFPNEVSSLPIDGCSFLPRHINNLGTPHLCQ